MLRRTAVRAFYNRGEQQRQEARRQSLLWDKQGKLLIGNALRYYWEEMGRPIKYTVAFIAFIIGYTKFVVWLEQRSVATVRDAEQSRLDYLRSSGKVKGERYLVVNSRQIDDPDFNNIPAYAGKDTPWNTKLYEDDKFSTGKWAGDEARHRGERKEERNKQ